MLFRTLLVAVFAFAAPLLWIGAAPEAARAQLTCPIIGQTLGPMADLQPISVQGSDPTNSTANSIAIPGIGNQTVNLTFSVRMERQNANPSFESMTADVLFNGDAVYSHTLVGNGPPYDETVVRAIVLPPTTDSITITSNLRLNNDPPESYTSGGLFLTVFGISMTTSDMPCETAWPQVPYLVEQCGVIGASEVIVPAAPMGVVIESSGWNDAGIWTVRYSPATGYVLPTGFQAEYTFTHPGPCQTDPPVPPVQTAVCGPNNDVVAIPDQPDKVILEDDSLWQDGTRTVTFSMLPGFTTTGPLAFTLTDEADPCPVEPEGKIVTVVFETSDQGSIEGAPYALYAPVASQADPAPYAEGAIGPGNTVVFDGLLSGEYRLTASPDGYEPVDTSFTVEDGTEPQVITIAVSAIQVPVSPEPSPTAAPTTSTQPAQTLSLTVQANSPPAVVTRLPDTGTGIGHSMPSMLLVGLMFTAFGAASLGPFRHARRR